MKRMLKYSVLFLICIFCVTVNAESNYDDLFINNKYTIYTDKNITNVGDMNDVIRDLMSSYYKQEYYNSYDDYSNLYIYLNSCSFDNSTCDFNVIRGIYKDGNYTNEQVKSYKNIEIEFENVNDDYFPFVNNEGNIVINYDESFFDDNSTKQNYISNYINSKQKYNNDDGTSVRYSYNSYSKLLKYIFVDENGNINKVH